MIIDILFPRLIFNLTLAFRALTEKLGCGVGGGGRSSDTKASHLLGPKAGFAWGCLVGTRGVVRRSVLTLQPLATLRGGFPGSSVIIHIKPSLSISSVTWPWPGCADTEKKMTKAGPTLGAQEEGLWEGKSQGLSLIGKVINSILCF